MRLKQNKPGMKVLWASCYSRTHTYHIKKQYICALCVDEEGRRYKLHSSRKSPRELKSAPPHIVYQTARMDAFKPYIFHIEMYYNRKHLDMRLVLYCFIGVPIQNLSLYKLCVIGLQEKNIRYRFVIIHFWQLHFTYEVQISYDTFKFPLNIFHFLFHSVFHFVTYTICHSYEDTVRCFAILK